MIDRHERTEQTEGNGRAGNRQKAATLAPHAALEDEGQITNHESSSVAQYNATRRALTLSLLTTDNKPAQKRPSRPYFSMRASRATFRGAGSVKEPANTSAKLCRVVGASGFS